MAKGDICKLEKWSVIVRPEDPYQAPELWSTLLSGKVYGHSRFSDGTEIQSSKIVKSEGRLVHTYSGTQYELGTPAEKYVKWCKERDIILDEENPVKIKD